MTLFELGVLFGGEDEPGAAGAAVGESVVELGADGVGVDLAPALVHLQNLAHPLRCGGEGEAARQAGFGIGLEEADLGRPANCFPEFRLFFYAIA